VDVCGSLSTSKTYDFSPSGPRRHSGVSVEPHERQYRLSGTRGYTARQMSAHAPRPQAKRGAHLSLAAWLYELGLHDGQGRLALDVTTSRVRAAVELGEQCQLHRCLLESIDRRRVARKRMCVRVLLLYIA